MNSNRNTEQEASEDSRETKIEEILNEFENINEKEVSFLFQCFKTQVSL